MVEDHDVARRSCQRDSRGILRKDAGICLSVEQQCVQFLGETVGEVMTSRYDPERTGSGRERVEIKGDLDVPDDRLALFAVRDAENISVPSSVTGIVVAITAVVRDARPQELLANRAEQGVLDELRKK